MRKKTKELSAVKALLGGLETKPRKHQRSFYISDDVYEDFMATCEELEKPGSQVVEALLRDFIATYGESGD